MTTLGTFLADNARLTVVQLLAATALAACASTTVVPVAYDSNASGFRIYDVKPILVVNGTSAEIKLIPNFNRAYAVQFNSFPAKNHTSIEIKEQATVGKIDAELDTTSVVSLLQNVAPSLLPKDLGTREGGQGGTGKVTGLRICVL